MPGILLLTIILWPIAGLSQETFWPPYQQRDWEVPAWFFGSIVVILVSGVFFLLLGFGVLE
jgi:hypothetical protein